MPGLVKIGKTTTSTAKRAARLASTGVAEKFEVLLDEFVFDQHTAESVAHRRLSNYRVSNRREFFKAPYPVVIKTAIAVCEEINRDFSARVQAVRIEVSVILDAKKLKKCLSPFRGGNVPVLVLYRNAGAMVDVALDSDWRVAVSADLATALYDAFGADCVRFLVSTP